MFVLEYFAIRQKVMFYTIREPEDAKTLQTMDFINRIRKTDYKPELETLMSLIIKRIGNKSGAKAFWFNRLEQSATALPPAKKGQAINELKFDEVNFALLNSKLRLYCLRLSDSVVVLFNGGIKETNGLAQNDPGVSIYFRDATRYASKIIQALNDNEICLKYKSVVGYDGEENNILIQ